MFKKLIFTWLRAFLYFCVELYFQQENSTHLPHRHCHLLPRPTTDSDLGSFIGRRAVSVARRPRRPRAHVALLLALHSARPRHDVIKRDVVEQRVFVVSRHSVDSFTGKLAQVQLVFAQNIGFFCVVC